VKILLILFCLLIYPYVAFSDASNIRINEHKHTDKLRDFTIAGQRFKTRATHAQRIIDVEKYNDNKSEYKVGNACDLSSSEGICASSNSISVGTTNSYIDEYSVFAVIGTGIRLPEEQIESYNGIDD
jgi:hypothetical protein